MDKSELIGGIWDSDIAEHPEKEYTFVATCGYECIIRRSMQWTYCGYVQLPKDHPYYDKHCDDIDDIYVHGNLTCSVDGLFGFECSHVSEGDISPLDATIRAKYPAMLNFNDKIVPHYWTFDEVKKETENMAKQFFNKK